MIKGYVVAEGVTDNPDARQLGDSASVRVVWSDRGALGEAVVDTTASRVDLSASAAWWILAKAGDRFERMRQRLVRMTCSLRGSSVADRCRRSTSAKVG